MVVLTVIIYATEIPDTTIRGLVSTTCGTAFLLGSAVCVTMGVVMTWYAVALSNVVAILVYICLIVPFLPESPTFLIVMEKEKEAIEVLRRFRGNYVNIDTEIAEIKKINGEAQETKAWSFLLQRKVYLRILVIVVLFLLNGFSGTNVIRANTVRILQSFGVTGDMNLYASVLFLVPVSGAFVLALLVDRLGRRGCLAMSFAFVMAMYAILGTLHYLQTHPLVSVPVELNETMLSSPRRGVFR